MKKTLIILGTAVVGLVAACNNFQKNPGGLEYKIFKNAGNAKIDSGDFVMFNLVTKTSGDSLINSSYEAGQPLFYEVAAKHMYEGDATDAIKLLGDGDSAEIRLNIDSLKKFAPGQTFKPNEKYISYILKIEKVLKKEKNEVDSVFLKRKKDFYGKAMEEATAKLEKSEDGKIQAYVKESGLKSSTTPEGLIYEIKAAGSEQRAALGDTVTVNYTGYLTKKDDKGAYKVFDTTDPKKGKNSMTYSNMKKYEPAKITVGQTVPGFSQGLTMVGKGGKITIVIPSKLGYGPQGAPPVISPFTPIVFEVEILDIKKGTAPKTANVPPPTVKSDIKKGNTLPPPPVAPKAKK